MIRIIRSTAVALIFRMRRSFKILIFQKNNTITEPGLNQNRKLFDSAFYLREYPDVRESGMNPFQHYLLHGRAEGRKPFPEDPGKMATNNGSGTDTHLNQEMNERDLLINSRHFSVQYYLDHNPDILESGVDPAEHYLQHGWRESRCPHPAFDTAFYLRSHPDVLESGMNPLVHYIRYGWAEGRVASEIPAIPDDPDQSPEVIVVAGEYKTPGHHYRVVNLVDAFSRLGIPASWTIPEILADQLSVIDRAKILILWRTLHSTEIQTIVARARKSGCLVVFDMDDLIFEPEIAVPEQMDAIRSLKRQQSELLKYCSGMQSTALLSDICTGTTMEIADGFERLGKKCYVLPNGYSRINYDRSVQLKLNRPVNPALIRIGYAAGTLTHQRDFAVALPALVQILREFPNTILTLFSKALDVGEFPELAPFSHRIEFRSMVPYPDLQIEIARFDINIAPLESTDFCNAKSELKFFEAALLGIPTIASPTPPFRRAINHGVNGFLPRSDKEWYECLRLLVTDPVRRASTGRNAFNFIRWRFGPDERNVLVNNFLAVLKNEFSLKIEYPGHWDDFAGLWVPPRHSVPATEIKSPFSTRKEIRAETRTGRLSGIGILVFVSGDLDAAGHLLESLALQTYQGIDLIICPMDTNPLLREFLSEWHALNSRRFNRISVAREAPGCTMPGWLNFAVEEFTSACFTAVEQGMYLLPDTIERFMTVLEASHAACISGVSLHGKGAFTVFRSASVIHVGGFDETITDLPIVFKRMTDRFQRAGEIMLTLPGTAFFHEPCPAHTVEEQEITDKQNQTILFIGHDDALAGAQVVLLNILRRLKESNHFRLILLLMSCENTLLPEYEKICEVIRLDRFFTTFHNPLVRRSLLASRIGPVDLVYGNTVLSSTIMEEISFLQAPVIFHIHEMESAITVLLNSKETRNLRSIASHFISCSGAVTQNLVSGHRIEPDRITTIEAFIQPPHPGSTQDRHTLRNSLQWASGTFVVLGCGSINYRKGVDLFIRTASELLRKGFTNFRFVWLGENQWDQDAWRWKAPSWDQVITLTSLAALRDKVIFPGPVENIYDFLPAADLFYLPSREDPFPLVVLEAAVAGIPTLCFKDSGGIPEAFGSGSIVAVTMESVTEAAEMIIRLSDQRDILAGIGKEAQKKVIARYTSDRAMPRIAEVCRRLICGESEEGHDNGHRKQTEKSYRWLFITTNDGCCDGGSEKLWIQSAIRCRENGDDVAVVIRQWEPEPIFIDQFIRMGIRVFYKDQDPVGAIHRYQADLAVISTGDQDEGTVWFEYCRTHGLAYVIVNHLTKEPAIVPVTGWMTPGLRRGYMAAWKVLFTGRNNLRLMERRLGCPIPFSGIFFNPTDVERFPNIPYPANAPRFQLATVGRLYDAHKGQRLAIELMNMPKWRERPVTLNMYGKGEDEEQLRLLVNDYGLNSIVFRGHTSDIHGIWETNHALLISSYMEGLPLVLTAAMMCGRLAVATDVGAHAEVIADNETGFLAKTPTLADLDEALERAWNRREEWDAIGLKARDFIHQYIPEDPIGHFLSLLQNPRDIKNKKQA